ncbi:MAG: DNA-binding protein WhiA [Actinomycetota bacterium]
MSLTRELREELARRELPAGQVARAEAAAALRFGGAWLWRGGADAAGWTLETPVAAVVRRIRSVLAEQPGARTAIEARRAGGLATEARYRLRVEGAEALCALGLTDATGAPLEAAPPDPPADDTVREGALRGALMAAGSLAGPGQEPHLEVRAPSEATARQLATLLGELGVEGAGVGAHAQGWRVVVKSGEAIGAVLARSGAHATFLAFDDGRLRRQLRGEATRAANADRANLGRSVAAASRQIAVIEGLLAEVGGEALPEDLRDVALARLANPDASLGELAGLLGAGRATVHRRLSRLVALAEDGDEAGTST